MLSLVGIVGGDPLDVGFGDHGEQGLFASPARFEEAGEVAAFAELGDGQQERAHFSVRSGSYSTTMVKAVVHSSVTLLLSLASGCGFANSGVLRAVLRTASSRWLYSCGARAG